MKLKYLFVSIAFFISATCLHSQQATERGTEDLDSLCNWIEGDFSNANQVKVDSTFWYTETKIKRVWNVANKEAWFMVRTHNLGTQHQMLRVRAIEEGMFEIAVFQFKNKADTDRVERGEWRGESSILSQQRGCEIYLQATGKKFFGSTHGTSCKSTIPQISYLSSEVSVYPMAFSWWEKGFTAENVQKYGPTKGPYWFERVKH